MKALWATLLRRQNAFSVTSKTRIGGNHGKLVLPHLGYIALVIIGVVWGVMREGWSPSMISNIAWAIIYIAAFAPFIAAAFERTPASTSLKKKSIVDTPNNIEAQL